MINKIRWFIQRGCRGYSDNDVWNFNFYLTNVLIGGITQLKTKSHGFPAQLTAEKWDEILGQIVNHLQASIDADENAATLKELKAGDAELQKGLKLICKWYGNLWD
jgi:hypothetical protein